MDITSLPAVPGARKRRKRLGRGIGSGHGKTSTRGQKGQRARTGSTKKIGFEGGQNPLIRRLPKRGFKRKATGRPPEREIVNVEQLNRFADGQRITAALLKERGLIHHADHQVKLLGNGELTKRLTIALSHVSEGAKAKVTKTGGTIEPGQGARGKGQGNDPQPPAHSPQPPV